MIFADIVHTVDTLDNVKSVSWDGASRTVTEPVELLTGHEISLKT